MVRSFPEPLVVGWPYDGTRRWYLAHRDGSSEYESYVAVLAQRQAQISRMMFEHGTAVLLTPLFGDALLARGIKYAKLGLSSLRQLGESPSFRQLYAEGIRVRFYGAYVEPLQELGLWNTIDYIKTLENDTAAGKGPLLLIGLFAERFYEAASSYIANLARVQRRTPTEREVIEDYYGVPVPRLSLYISYARPALYDVPFLTSGYEDLYSTLGPSPSMTKRQFREILYDHYVARRTVEEDYDQLSDSARQLLKSYVTSSEGMTLGLGRVDASTRTWLPWLPNNVFPLKHEREP